MNLLFLTARNINLSPFRASPPHSRPDKVFHKPPHFLQRGAVAESVELLDPPSIHIDFSGEEGLFRLARPTDKEHHLPAENTPVNMAIPLAKNPR